MPKLRSLLFPARFRFLTLSLVIACCVGLAGSAARCEELDINRFEKSVVLTGLVQPMELEIAPDGRIFASSN